MGNNAFSFQQKKNTAKGFTIIELMVSASIIAIISLLVIANFRGSNQRAGLDNEAERLSSVIRQAHIDSLIGLTVGGSRPLGGFGIHISKCSSNCEYYIFADKNNDHVYTPAADGNYIARFGMLEDAVYVDSVLPADNIYISFVPPQGKIYINRLDTYPSATITLGYVNTGYVKAVVLNSISGQIEVF